MANIFGIGIDAVQIDRMDPEKLSAHVISRLFHPDEIIEARSLNERMQAQYYASRFAAKEAFAKALGVGFTKVIPSEVCVKSEESGKPELCIEGATANYVNARSMMIHLSLTHEKNMALAMVILERLEECDGKK